MGNKKDLIWYCILFTDESKSEVFKVLKCNTIIEMSYYLGIKPQVIRNYYHKNIKERGILKYCNITQNLNI
tara:strand:+ start:32 stop:244 length:213 start_codon:yes stop_codon:yes gene_type:complete